MLYTNDGALSQSYLYGIEICIALERLRLTGSLNRTFMELKWGWAVHRASLTGSQSYLYGIEMRGDLCCGAAGRCLNRTFMELKFDLSGVISAIDGSQSYLYGIEIEDATIYVRIVDLVSIVPLWN